MFIYSSYFDNNVISFFIIYSRITAFSAMQIWLYICRMKLRNLFYSVVLICCFLLVIYQVTIKTEAINYFICFILMFSQAQINYWETDVNNLPKILWWTPFTLRDDLEVIYCGDYKCAVTDNRSYTKDVKVRFEFNKTVDEIYFS